MLRILDITSPDINNGNGCRVTVWFAGCPFKCVGCHNKESWDFNQGTQYTVQELFTKLKPILDKEYIKGITFSGGEPLERSVEDNKELFNLIFFIRENYKDTKDIWIYSGNTFEELIKNKDKKNILLLCDVLVDGRFILEQRNITLPFRGSNNQRLIDLKESFEKRKIIEYKIDN